MKRKSLLFLLLFALMAPWAAQAQTRERLTFDFEDNTIPSTWTNDATYPWVVTDVSEGSGHTGTYCIKSGNTGVHGSSSTISATFTFWDDGTISFLGGCYGEGTSTFWDKCIFSIDGEQQFAYGARDTWETYTFNVEAGEHTFTWAFTKDGSAAGTGDAFFVDDIVVELGEAPACPPPANVAASNIGAHGATISWTGTNDSYIVMVGQPTVTANYDFEDNAIPAAFTNDATYPWTVVANTHSGAYCAKSATGNNSQTSALELEVTLTSAKNLTFSAKVSSEANYDKAYFSIDGSVKINGISGAGDWIDYSYALAAGTHTLRWYYTKDSSVASNDDCFYVDDIVLSSVESWDESHTASASPYTFTDLDPETEYYVCVKGICGSDQSDPSSAISFTTLPTCIAPTAFAASNVMGHNATLSWTSDGSAWQVAYTDDATIAPDNLTPVAVTTNSYQLTGLTAETPYYAYVRTDCDGTYSAWTSTTFTTTVSCPAPTGFTYSEVTAHTATLSWTEAGEATDWVVEYGTAQDFTGATSVNVSTTPSLNLTGLTSETTYYARVKAVCGEGDESSWVTKSFTTLVSCPAPTGFACTAVTANTAALSWTEAGEATNWVVEYGMAADFTGATSVNVTDTPSVELTGLTAETIYYARVKAVCGDDDASAWVSTNFEPTAKLVIGSGTSTSSNLPTTTCYNYSFTQQIYTAAELGEANAILSIDFYSTNGAAKARKFDIYMVRTDKSSFESNTDWIAITADDLVYSVDEYTWQQGWNSFELDNPFVYDGTSNVAIVVYDEKVTNYECSVNFRVFDATGQSIYVRQDSAPYDPFNATYTATGLLNVKNQIRILKGTPNPCAKPTELAATTVFGHSAVLNWTSDATAWQICVNDDETNLIDVTEIPYTLGNLTPETTYTVKVRANCGEGSFSAWTGAISFTTTVACPAPTFEVEATAESATITIAGEAETYNVRYRTPRGFNYGFEQAEAWTITDFDPCTVYDGDQTQCYGFEGETFTNIPFTGSTIAFQSSGTNLVAHTGNAFGLMVSAIPSYYPEGVTHSDDWFILPELTIERGSVFSFWGREITTQYGDETINVGIYGSTDGTFASYLEGGEAIAVNSTTWTKYTFDLSEYAGQTIRLAINYVSNDIFGFMFDDIFVGNPEDDTWDYTFNEVNSPYEITGLTESTEYEVQVQANCGEEGVSDWSATVAFMTLPLCEVPTNVAVADITTNSAVVTWESEATSFDIEVNGEVTEDVTSPYTLNDLDPGTIYSVRVRANCGETGYSAWTTAVDFATSCLAYELPYEYGFETADDMNCWSMMAANSANSFGVYAYDEAYEGSNVFVFSSYNQADQYAQVLMSPELNSGDAEVAFEFNYRVDGYGTESLYVLYSTTTNDLEEFEMADAIEADNTDEWLQYQTTLPAGTKYVALYYNSNYQYYLLVDGFKFEEAAGVTQVLELSAGWNNISVYLAVEDPVAMLDQLKEGLGANALWIEGSKGYTEYDGEEWFGDLDDMGITNEQSYMINVVNACTVELQGMPANPADYEITIKQGWNRIGFPSAEELEISVALGEFPAEEGDMLEGPEGYTEYDGEEWFGDIEMMVPGHGYMYLYTGEGEPTLVFQTGAKTRRVFDATVVKDVKDLRKAGSDMPRKQAMVIKTVKK